MGLDECLCSWPMGSQPAATGHHQPEQEREGTAQERQHLLSTHPQRSGNKLLSKALHRVLRPLDRHRGAGAALTASSVRALQRARAKQTRPPTRSSGEAAERSLRGRLSPGINFSWSTVCRQRGASSSSGTVAVRAQGKAPGLLHGLWAPRFPPPAPRPRSTEGLRHDLAAGQLEAVVLPGSGSYPQKPLQMGSGRVATLCNPSALLQALNPASGQLVSAPKLTHRPEINVSCAREDVWHRIGALWRELLPLHGSCCSSMRNSASALPRVIFFSILLKRRCLL